MPCLHCMYEQLGKKMVHGGGAGGVGGGVAGGGGGELYMTI